VSEKDLAKELWERRNDPEEWSEEAEDIEVRPRRSSVVSFRLPPEEFDALEKAMARTGESLSEFIRTALALRLRRDPIKSTIELTHGDPDYPEQIMVTGYNIVVDQGTKASYVPEASPDQRPYRSARAEKRLDYG
jgi:hypothetical protein